MAKTKEAIAIILDVGTSMTRAAPDGESCLDICRSAVSAILQRKLFAELKDEVALILVGTDGTANEQATHNRGCYKHVTLAHPLGPIAWPLLEYVETGIEMSNSQGDFIDAIVVAMDHLYKATQSRKDLGAKQLIVFSDLDSPFGIDHLDDVVASMKKNNFEITFIGPDSHDPASPGSSSDGSAEGRAKPRSTQQQAGCTLMRRILKYVEGACFSFEEVLPALMYFQTKQVKPAAWKVQLEIGNDLSIPVVGYIRTREAKAKSFQNVYAKEPEAKVQRLRTYHLNDEEETEIEKDDIVDGQRYGATLVPFTAEDKDALKYSSQKCLQVLGFTKIENVKRGRLVGEGSMAFVPEETDVHASVALSAFINSLYETNNCAIVRRVYRANSKVELGVLVPVIKVRYECLYYNALPFYEDLRQYTFSSLPVHKPEGKYAPTQQQLEAVDNLIVAMDLSSLDKDEEGKACEALKPNKLFNPYIQRLYQCLYHRANHPTDGLPAINPQVAQILAPPEGVLINAEEVLSKIRHCFPLKENVAKDADNIIFKEEGGNNEVHAKRPRLEAGEELDKNSLADALKAKVTQVGSVTPVADFLALIADKDNIMRAIDQLCARINELVQESFANQAYSKAMDCVVTLRKECITNQRAEVFNSYLHTLKGTLPTRGRKDFWEDIVKASITLISRDESPDSVVTAEQQQVFLTSDNLPAKSEADEDLDDTDALLDKF